MSSLILRKVLLGLTVCFFIGIVVLEGVLSKDFIAFKLIYGGLLILQLWGYLTKSTKVQNMLTYWFQYSVLLGVIIFPVIMLFDTYKKANMQYFMDNLIIPYIIFETALMLVLLLASEIYIKEQEVSPGNLARNLLSPLSLVFYIRLYWIIVFETQRLVTFSLHRSFYRIEYIVLTSIPLFIASFLLTLRKNKVGYIIGMIMGIIHSILTSFLVVFRVNPGYGPLIVIPSSVIIAWLCFKDYRKFYGNLKNEPIKVAS